MRKSTNSCVPQIEEEGNRDNACHVRSMFKYVVGRPGIADLNDLVDGIDNLTDGQEDSEPSADGELPIILLDLETSGFGRSCDILQIAAKFGTETFETYVNPTQPVSEFASQVNGLTNCNGVLKYNGVSVQSVPLCEAMRNLHSWLASFRTQCYIATHNFSFDGPRLYDAITSCSLRDDFRDVVYGFIDTLPVIKKHTGRKGKGECTIAGLAEWLNVSSEGAHHALCDVEILNEILQKANITHGMLINGAKTYSQQLDKWDNDKHVKTVLPSLDPLIGVVGETIRKKMVMASITIDHLKDAYRNSERKGIEELLGDKVNGKIVVTNRKDKINAIVDWIENN